MGAIASWLAIIGIFGLVAFTGAQRTREIGIRMALGARAYDVLRVVLGQYVTPFAVGGLLRVDPASALRHESLRYVLPTLNASGSYSRCTN